MPSGYHDYVKRMDAPARDLPLAEKIKECQAKHGQTYGYRRVHIRLERQGIHHNPKTILRVMQKYNLLSAVRRKKYRNYGDYLHRYDNLLNRDFNADRPNHSSIHPFLQQPKNSIINKTDSDGVSKSVCRLKFNI